MIAREDLACGLERARQRTLTLTDFDDAELHRQYNPLMSPLVWDLAHIGQQEELWLLRDGNPDRPGLLPACIESLYDAFVHSRASRVELPLLSPAQSRSYCSTVRAAALDALDSLPADDDEVAFRFGLVISHENQHDETMLQALNLRTGAPILGPRSSLPRGRPDVAGTSVLIPGGEFVLGVDAATEPLSLDNERPAHIVEVPSFRIGLVPVTNGEWAKFIDNGGYTQQRWWSERGWEHRVQARLTAPQFWNPDRSRTRFGHLEEIPADEPVQHVSFFEAEAYAAWAGARLPTEVEWEHAARQLRTAPVHANFADRGAFHPLPSENAASDEPTQMFGDVWEWTQSSYGAYPGYRPLPGAVGEYNGKFMCNQYVLRGGSCATPAGHVRTSYRNFFPPDAQWQFSGLRLARDI